MKYNVKAALCFLGFLFLIVFGQTAYATTSIGTDIQTGGMLTVSGTSTLATTTISGPATFGSTTVSGLFATLGTSTLATTTITSLTVTATSTLATTTIQSLSVTGAMTFGAGITLPSGLGIDAAGVLTFGTSTASFINIGNTNATTTIFGAFVLSSPLGVSYGGTGATTTSGIRSSIGAQIADIAQRAPLQTDDVNSNYATSANWRQGNRIWQNVLNQAGFAEWFPYNFYGTPLPGDAVASTTISAQALYAGVQLKKSYSGSLLRVARLSDGAQTDIGFLANGQPDLATFGQFCSGPGSNAPVVGNTTTVSACLIAKLYDQSGNGNDIISYATSTAPVAFIDNQGRLGWSFFQWTGTVSAGRALYLPTTLSTNKLGVSVFSVNSLSSLANNAGVGNVGLWMLGAPGNAGTHLQGVHYGGGSNGSGVCGLSIWNDGACTANFGTVSAGILGTAPAQSWVMSSSTNHFMGVEGYPGYYKTGFSSATLTGGILGNATTTGTDFSNGLWDSTQYGFEVFNNYLSSADTQAVVVANDLAFKLVPQARCNVVLQGESVWSGYEQPGALTVPNQLQDLLPQSSRVYDFALASTGAGNTTNSYILRGPNQIQPLYNASNPCNVAVINIGTNDFWANNSAPTLATSTEEAYITQIATTTQSYGYQVFVATEIDRGQMSNAMKLYIQEINRYIYADAAARGYGVVPLDTDPKLSVLQSSASSCTYFSDCPNGIHPNALGASIIARAIFNTIQPYVKP